MLDETIMHSQIKIYASFFMLVDTLEKFSAVPTIMHIYAQNLDEIFEKAARATCELQIIQNIVKETLVEGRSLMF